MRDVTILGQVRVKGSEVQGSQKNMTRGGRAIKYIEMTLKSQQINYPSSPGRGGRFFLMIWGRKTEKGNFFHSFDTFYQKVQLNIYYF